MNLRPGSPVATSSFDLGVEKRLKFIKEQVALMENCNILEVGCGYSIYAYALAPISRIACGVDININYLQKAKAKANSKNATFLLMSAENLAFKENTFDVILMIEVLEHINNDEKTLEEVFRIIKPGGKLIVTVPNKFFPFETHAIRVRSKIIGLPFGIPFLSWLPARVRKVFETARVYTLSQIKLKCLRAGFSKIEFRFIAPTLDGFRDNSSYFIKFIRVFFDLFENHYYLSVLLGSTIRLRGEKEK